jgi:hypothetical protein
VPDVTALMASVPSAAALLNFNIDRRSIMASSLGVGDERTTSPYSIF